MTLFRCECPHCGHIGLAIYCYEQGQVKCRECGERFDSRHNTYRPVTRGMTEEERAERERAIHRAYYQEHREQILARSREYRQTAQYRETYRAYKRSHKEEIAARKKAYREAHKEEIRAYQKAYDSTPERREHNRQNSRRYYWEHREEILAKKRAKRAARKKLEGENE